MRNDRKDSDYHLDASPWVVIITARLTLPVYALQLLKMPQGISLDRTPKRGRAAACICKYTVHVILRIAHITML